MSTAQTDAKIVSVREVLILRDKLRATGKQVVLTNGVFDLIHVGHVRYVQEARALGDMLVVALNSDQSVRRLKGPTRPLMDFQSRAIVMSALECVDLVVQFDEDTATALINEIRPDIYVKGGDYRATAGEGEKGYLPEAGVVASYGGRVQILSFIPGHSTTALIERIKTGHVSA